MFEKPVHYYDHSFPYALGDLSFSLDLQCLNGHNTFGSALFDKHLWRDDHGPGGSNPSRLSWCLSLNDHDLAIPQAFSI